jgi:protease I
MDLLGRTIVVLGYPGYQELELWYPVFRAREERGTVVIVTAGEESESYLGYPVIGDREASEVDATQVSALIAPGTVAGNPSASTAQRELIARVSAAGGRLYASGSGAQLIRDVAAMDERRTAEGPDGVGELVQVLLADIAETAERSEGARPS